LIAGQHQENLPAVNRLDIDGDGVQELLCTIAAKTSGYNGGLFVLKKHGAQWKKVFEHTGEACSVYSFTQTDLTGDGKTELLVSYFVGASAGESLVAYAWENQTLTPLTDAVYNRLEIEDMPDKIGEKDGKSELGVWLKDTGSLYIVDVLRYENRHFVPAEDVYPYYFKKVASYYKGLLDSMDGATKDAAYKSPIGYYYLADAYVKAGEYQKALDVYDKAKRRCPPKEISPGEQPYMENLTLVRGIALLGTGVFKEAERIMQPLADKHPIPGSGQMAILPATMASYYMGEIAQKQGDDAKAHLYYNQVLQFAAKTADSYEREGQERWLEKSKRALHDLPALK
jgi:pentatricopeptide repeat protein